MESKKHLKMNLFVIILDPRLPSGSPLGEAVGKAAGFREDDRQENRNNRSLWSASRHRRDACIDTVNALHNKA